MGLEALLSTQIIGLNEAIDDRVDALLVEGTGITLTYDDGAGTLTIASTGGGIGGSTGSTDNAVLRADGTGGTTIQDSAFVIPDNYTASPNNTVNHASIQATGASTNVSISIVPKGTGSLSLQVPDGTVTAGNARGENAVDFQVSRNNAAQVASGLASAILASKNSTCSSVGGYNAVIASDGSSITTGGASANLGTIGCSIGASGNAVIIGSQSCSTDVINHSVILASRNAKSNRSCQITQSGDRRSANGDCQRFWLAGSCKTTTNSDVEFTFGTGVGNAPVYVTVASGFQISGTLLVQGIKSDGSVSARYARHITIRRVSNTTTLDDAQTIGTDLVNGTSITIEANDTNDRLAIKVAGVASEIWRWQCYFDGIEQTYGT